MIRPWNGTIHPIMVRLFFTGIKHSGKTTQARLVARALGLEAYDSDDLVLSAIKEESIRDFYRTHGKEAFMEAELSAVDGFVRTHPSFVLSLGGGASDNEGLLRLMKDSGKIIYLVRNENDMLPVILKHGLPAFLDKDDPEGSFHALYERRDSIYRAWADIIIDLGPYGDREETAAAVAAALEENGICLAR